MTLPCGYPIIPPSVAPPTCQKPIVIMRQPACPSCHDDLYVRAEQVISGRRITQAYYCGRCNREWHIESVPLETGERRRGERRTRRLERALAALEKKVAPAVLVAKRGRRRTTR